MIAHMHKYMERFEEKDAPAAVDKPPRDKVA